MIKINQLIHQQGLIAIGKDHYSRTKITREILRELFPDLEVEEPGLPVNFENLILNGISDIK